MNNNCYTSAISRHLQLLIFKLKVVEAWGEGVNMFLRNWIFFSEMARLGPK